MLNFRVVNLNILHLNKEQLYICNVKKIILILLFPFFVFSQAQKEVLDYELFATFYNVENLFDTIDDPNTRDNEFLPTSDKKWDTYKYNYKISQLNKVFANMIKDQNDNQLPEIIGLCEVENKVVIEDLLKSDVFKNHNYKIVHKDSPDGRGIDCAILVDKKINILKTDFIEINNPNEERPTRDIVYANLEYNGKTINVYINHWPSRWGGQEASNHKRVFVSNVLRKHINKNSSKNDFNLIMGDFNDYPDNESLSVVLVKKDLDNLMVTKNVIGIGSYNYRGDWNWLDQIITSDISMSNIKVKSVGAYQKEFMMYKNKKGEIYPSRSFGGNNWYGGFSDHLPVFLNFGWNN